ncbi:serine--tRNA ligase, mitochondrial [Metopolophium dirhodum]|uniref:serine--tRNA ligase, mitochondrial n=1 Tax=Metopolophium dirhodum TaxID=44670 RepID=UPI00298F58BF|nr:serine--tRNA ligase, mitochondrial [Metopolophium dirhodum]
MPSLEDKFKDVSKKTHPRVEHIQGDFEVVKSVGQKPVFKFKPLPLSMLNKVKYCLKTENLSNYCGDRSYYFIGPLAKIEHALVQYTLAKLIKKGFKLVSVPDILPDELIERCGMDTAGERNQVYTFDNNYYGKKWCLSGTSEMALAGSLMNKNVSKDKLPLKLCSVSRCYRAEVSSIAEEKGIFRVHQFTKVEMFGACLPEESENMALYFRNIQEDLLQPFNLHYRVLDMAKHELGTQAYRKYDIEAWMPGCNKYGEISSCSDCTNYQSERLGIHSDGIILHTVNGTACAVPRLIIALAETHQTVDGSLILPEKLNDYVIEQNLFKSVSTFPKFTPVQAHRYKM